MKIVYTYKEGMQPLFIDGSAGVQRVLVVLKDGGNTYVHFCDDYYRTTYLNKVINQNASSIFHIDNLERIQTDEEFYYYLKVIEDNYNYSGTKKEEKITGHDVGGPVFLDQQGNAIN